MRDLGACKATDEPYLVARPEFDLSDIDASGLDLHFFPSLNSPYTAIIYDKSIAMAESCKIKLHHKPVLPMIMRGVPAPRSKMGYILFDTKREADFFGAGFDKLVTPIGTPTRRAYSLFPWARAQGKDTTLLSIMLRYSWAEGKGLYKASNFRAAVEEAGLDWKEASQIVGDDKWKAVTEQNQTEMVEQMGLWACPVTSFAGQMASPIWRSGDRIDSGW